MAGYKEAEQFLRWNGLEYGTIVLKMSQNIDKVMVYILKESGDDYQQGSACISQPVAFNEQLSTCGHLTGLKTKADQSTFGSGVVVSS